MSSLQSTQELVVDQKPLLVGERTNTNGSKKFKQLLEKDDWHGLVEMAKEQEREGVHVLDVCVDYVGRDGVRDMKEVIKRYNEVLTKPMMLDSTEVPVIEAGLKLCSGKAIINSINLEDGRKTLDPENDPREEVRRGTRRAHHRREGPGRHRGVEVRGREAHLRHRRERVRHPAERPDVRHARVPAVHRAGADPQERHRDV